MAYADPEQRRQYAREWYQRNKDRAHARYEANREQVIARSAEWKRANPDKVLESSRRYRLANSEKLGEYQRRWRAANPEKVREQQRREQAGGKQQRQVHGWTPEERAAMLAAQEGRCCYCERPLPEDLRRVHTDHDHSCTCGPERSCRFCRRGLACKACNQLIGLADEDPGRLERIAANLRVLKAEARERISGKPQQEALPIDIKRAARQQASG